MDNAKFKKNILIILICASISACGGGGGGCDRNTDHQPPAPPTNTIPKPPPEPLPGNPDNNDNHNDMTACEEGFVLVYAQHPYTDRDFCISQFEMRHGGDNMPISTPEGDPWNLSRDPSMEICDSVGMSLPTNAQWQTIVRQSENIPENWSGENIGDGTLATDLEIIGGDILYDFGDGVWEHVSSNAIFFNEGPMAGQVYLATDETHPYDIEIDGVEHGWIYHFGPEYDYSEYDYDPMLGTMTNRYSPSIMRGGDDNEPGIYGVALNHAPWEDPNGVISKDAGFRCAYYPEPAKETQPENPMPE